MKYREHVNIGVIFFPFTVYLIKHCQTAGYLIPFVADSIHRDIVSNLIFFLCFFMGLSLPDIDIKFYGHAHRVSSPLHDIVNHSVFYLITVVLANFGHIMTQPDSCVWFWCRELIKGHTNSASNIIEALLDCVIHNPVVCSNLSYAMYAVNALSFGCISHLFGDFIQGGIGCRHRRIGIKSFNWQRYSKTFNELFVRYVLFCFTIASILWVYLNLPKSFSIPLTAVFVCSFAFSSYIGALTFYLMTIIFALSLKFGCWSSQFMKF